MDSWESVDVEALNSRVSEAERGGEAWTRHAVGTVLASLGYGLDGRSVELRAVGNRGEVADTVVVVVARDGFNDDSVRGDWNRAVVYRTVDGTWRFREVQRAYRCWRVRSLDAYSGGRCP